MLCFTYGESSVKGIQNRLIVDTIITGRFVQNKKGIAYELSPCLDKVWLWSSRNDFIARPKGNHATSW